MQGFSVQQRDLAYVLERCVAERREVVERYVQSLASDLQPKK